MILQNRVRAHAPRTPRRSVPAYALVAKIANNCNATGPKQSVLMKRL